jgi:uncharacterized protein DUF1761
MFRNVNWIGVIVAAIVMYMIGWVWYDMLFKAQYLGAMPAQPNADMTKSMIYGAINTLVAAIGLGIVVPRLGDGWMGGAKTGLIAAIFFAGTTEAMGFIYGGRPSSLIGIDFGYLIVMYVVGGAIVGGLRLGRRA